MSLTGSCFSSESAPGALPSWDSRTRWNNLCHDLTVTAGSKRTCELTSSIVPRGTSFEKTSTRPVGHCPTAVYGDYRRVVVRANAARPLDLLGRAERSTPNAAWRRAEGAGLDRESADRAIINDTAARHYRTLSERSSTRFYGYSITSSARASSVGGTSMPSVFAVLRLIKSSYFTGACTGRSAGFGHDPERLGTAADYLERMHGARQQARRFSAAAARSGRALASSMNSISAASRRLRASPDAQRPRFNFPVVGKTISLTRFQFMQGVSFSGEGHA